MRPGSNVVCNFRLKLAIVSVAFFSRYSSEAQRNMEMLGLMVNEPRLTPRQLATLEVPVLVIAGTRDMIKRSHTEALARAIPRSTLVFIRGNHFIARKKPEAFNRAVDDFLRHLQEKEE